MNPPDAAAEAEHAVRALHAEHAPALLAWARGRVGDRDEAEEIVQETLLLAWRKRHQFDPDRGTERTWLFGIARNVAAGRHRRRYRHLEVVDLTVAPESVDDGAELARLVEDSLVRDAVHSLGESHRSVVVAAYYEGRTVREIAERTGLPVGTVKSRLFYALRALRARLEEVEVLR